MTSLSLHDRLSGCVTISERRMQVQQLKERAAKEGQTSLDADQKAKLASEEALIQEIRSLGGDA